MTPPSTLWLPLDVLRLAGRFLVPLVLWFSVGQIVRYLLVQAMIRVNRIELLEQLHVNRVAAMLLLTLMVILQMAVVVGMLYTVRRGLRTNTADERFSVALARSLMPFLVVYFAWNLVKFDVFEVVRADMQANFGEDVNNIFASALGGQATKSDNKAGDLFLLDSLGMPVLLGITALAFVLRWGFEKWYERSEGRVAGVGMAYFEGAFSLFGIFSVVQLYQGGTAFIQERAIWAGTVDRFRSAGESIPGWTEFWALFGEVIAPLLKDAVGLPLVWLAIAILVYGRDVEDHRAVVAGTRLEDEAARMEGASGFVQQILGWTTGSWDKWVPIANALRLIVRAGLPLLGLFCLLYAAIDLGAEYLWRFAVERVGGDHELLFWAWAWHPLDLGRLLVVEVLRIALLAATFGLAVRRSEALAAAPPPPPPPAPAGEPVLADAPRS